MDSLSFALVFLLHLSALPEPLHPKFFFLNHTTCPRLSRFLHMWSMISPIVPPSAARSRCINREQNLSPALASFILKYLPASEASVSPGNAPLSRSPGSGLHATRP